MGTSAEEMEQRINNVLRKEARHKRLRGRLLRSAAWVLLATSICVGIWFQRIPLLFCLALGVSLGMVIAWVEDRYNGL